MKVITTLNHVLHVNHLQNFPLWPLIGLSRNLFLRQKSTDVETVVPKQTLTPLEDLHGRKHDYLRISLTERCNLRCQYCMPAEGVPLSPKSNLLSRTELMRLVRVFVALGVHKVRLTGGEPTLRSDLTDLVHELSTTPGMRTVAMTSNGIALTRRLPALQSAGLTALNLSLDTLRPDRFERMARRPGLPRVLASIDLALQLGFRPVKINTVLMKGFNDDEIYDFVQFTKDREVEVRFIEFMPFAGNEWSDGRMVTESEALAALQARFPGMESAGSSPCNTATLWRVPGYCGHVGFISSMTRPFCNGCNRLRLTADGHLKVCLFGAAETSLRDALRAGANDCDLQALVRAALRRKLPQHAGQNAKYCPLQESSNDSDRRLRGLTRLQSSRLHGRAGSRAYSTHVGDRLTHLDDQGCARMVNVGDKTVSARVAEAECYVKVSEKLLRVLREGDVPKGDAISVAQIAGVLAAKRTADLIPLCHSLPLDCVNVRVYLPEAQCEQEGGQVRITCEAHTKARTGVEMEALTGCALAALTIYDMCKAVDRGMVIHGLRVLRKEGGKSDTATGR